MITDYDYLETDSPSLCAKCSNTLRNCTCPDIDERLAELTKSPHLAYRWCQNCDKHYARCNCIFPFWIRSDTRKPMVEANLIQQKMQAKR